MDNLARQDFNCQLNDLTSLYLSERNGLLLWRALKLCHDAGEPVPNNLLDKFSEWAGKLESATNPREVAKVLEMSGNDKDHKGSKHLVAVEQRRAIASDVVRAAQLYGIKPTNAFTIVAINRGIHVSVVKAAYYNFLKPQKQKTTAGLSVRTTNTNHSLDVTLSSMWR